METMPHIDGYAAALLEIARAEGDVERLSDEVYRAAQAMEANVELREALADPQIPAGRKLGIVEDLLGERASRSTVSAVHLLVHAGRARDMAAVATRMAELVAERQGAVVAEVRTAVALDPDQVVRLEAALAEATGQRVEAKVVVDPSVVGGVVTKIGDTVFDGTVKGRLDELREEWK